MPLLDFDSILVLVDPRGDDAQAAFRFWQNGKCRRFGRAKDALTEEDGDSSNEIYLGAQDFDPDASVPVHLRLSFDPSPKDVSRGFVFGSDPETCDVLLAENKHSGVSGNHFSINVDWQTGNPLITCLTPMEGSTGVRILSGQNWVLYLHNAWKVLDPGTTTTIRISDEMKFVVHSPSRESREAAYSNNLQRYFKKCQDAVPELTHLKLFDPEPTPLLVSRGRGLTGKKYFTTNTVVGEKVIVCEAQNHQNRTRDSQKFIIKRFRNVNGSWTNHVICTLSRLCKLGHRHIVAPEDIVTDTAEYMPVYLPEPPETLADRHIREPLLEADAAEVLAQVFEALKFLHANDIVHGGLYPGSIRISHSSPWSIKLSDIGLLPFVDLEGSEEREMYASNRKQGLRYPRPVMDTWSAGVVGLNLLSPNGLPPRPVKGKGPQSRWVEGLAKAANDFHSAQMLRPEGKKEAAFFLTRALKFEFSERLTAEQCLQDPWIKHRPKDAEDAEGSGDATETEEPRTTVSKDKQRQTSRHTSVASSSSLNWQLSGTRQSLGCSEGTPTGSRHTSIEPTDSVSRQVSVAPPHLANHEEFAQKVRRASAGPSFTVPSNRTFDGSTYDPLWNSRPGLTDGAETYPHVKGDPYMGFAHCGSNSSSQVSHEGMYAAVDARAETTATGEEQPTVSMMDAFPSILGK